MSDTDKTQSYLDLVGQTYGVLVEAASKANHRMLDNMKSAYEIVSRPYTSTAYEATYRENLDRAGQLVELTVAAAQKSGAEAAEVAEKLSAQAALWQEKYVEAMRGLFQTGLSNFAYVKDAADQTYQGFAKRVEEIQTRAAAGVSSN